MSEADRPGREPYPAARPSDPYLEWDAAYVLGALSPAERRDFEGHLRTCAGCRAAVAEVAGMPGLLAQVSPEDALSLAGDAQDPGDELPRRALAPDLLASHPSATGSPGRPGSASAAGAPGGLVPTVVRLDRQRRRLVRAVTGLAAALVLLAGVVGVAAVRGSFGLSRPAAAPVRLAFTPVVPTGITALVDVVPVSGGTDLRVECQYATADPEHSYAGREYSIVVTDTSGHATAVKTWTVKAGKQMTPSGRSDLPVSKISTIEIRPAHSSQALLRADLR